MSWGGILKSMYSLFQVSDFPSVSICCVCGSRHEACANVMCVYAFLLMCVPSAKPVALGSCSQHVHFVLSDTHNPSFFQFCNDIVCIEFSDDLFVRVGFPTISYPMPKKLFESFVPSVTAASSNRWSFFSRKGAMHKVVTLDDWAVCTRCLTEKSVWIYLMMVCFIIVTSFTVMSLLTGVRFIGFPS